MEVSIINGNIIFGKNGKLLNSNKNPVLEISDELSTEYITIGDNIPSIKATGIKENIDLNILSKGNGNVIINNIKYPNKDGYPGQILYTNGNGTLEFTNNIQIPITLPIKTNDNSIYNVFRFNPENNKIYDIECKILIKTNNGNCGKINVNKLIKMYENKITIIGTTINRIMDDILKSCKFDINIENNAITGIIIGELNINIDWLISYKISNL